MQLAIVEYRARSSPAGRRPTRSRDRSIRELRRPALTRSGGDSGGARLMRSEVPKPPLPGGTCVTNHKTGGVLLLTLGNTGHAQVGLALLAHSDAAFKTEVGR